MESTSLDQQIFDTAQSFFLSKGGVRVEDKVKELLGTIETGVPPGLRVLAERMAIGVYLLTVTPEVMLGGNKNSTEEELHETTKALLYAILLARESTRVPTPSWVLESLFNGEVVDQLQEALQKIPVKENSDEEEKK